MLRFVNFVLYYKVFISMKKKVAVIGGGDSSEVVVSVKSASQLMGMMDAEKYDLYLVFISGNIWEVQIGADKYPINKSNFSFEKDGTTVLFDFAYITIHGTPGENGILQSYFELVGIPYSSCGVFVSSLTFNKFACKTFLNEFGIKSAKGKLIRKGMPVDVEDIASLGFPCFVKPNNGGSSFGVSKVLAKEHVMSAVENAFKEDNEVIVEEFIEGIEITNGAYMVDGQVHVLPITEIVSETDFFDYNAKYEGKSKEITPARLSESQTLECKAITAKVYKALNCSGIVRVDYIVSNGAFYMLEINTVPGMSAASIIPQQIRAEGLCEKEVFSAVIEECSRKKMK